MNVSNNGHRDTPANVQHVGARAAVALLLNVDEDESGALPAVVWEVATRLLGEIGR